MRLDNLEKIYLEYLKRYPTPQDINAHRRKEEDDFIQEVLRSPEYLLLQEKGVPDLEDVNIAVLLPGTFRRFSAKKGLQNLCVKYPNTKIFVHTWDTLGFYKSGKRGWFDKKYDEETPKEVEAVTNVIKDIPNIASYKIECNTEFLKNLKIKQEGNTPIYFNRSARERFMYSQYYSIHQAFKLCEEYSKKEGIKFDIVIKIRPDTYITSGEFDQYNLLNMDSTIFVTNDESGHSHPVADRGFGCARCNELFWKKGEWDLRHVGIHYNIICDYIAYSNMENMKHYCDLYNHMDRFYLEFEKFNLKTLEGLDQRFKRDNLAWNEEENSYDILTQHASHHVFKCTFPEQLLRHHLEGYPVVKSKTFKVKVGV